MAAAERNARAECSRPWSNVHSIVVQSNSLAYDRRGLPPGPSVDLATMSKGPATDRLAVSLFTGAGGLDLGLEAAGFRVAICVEVDNDARATLALNKPDWLLAEPGDAAVYAKEPRLLRRQARLRRREVTLLSGGPPCQPWSKSGYWRRDGASRLRDPRSRTLHAYMKVAEDLLPHVLMLENVLGFTYGEANEGLAVIRRHLDRINRSHGTKYALQVITLNAADYGVPQLRERVFLLAHAGGRSLTMPAATHGPDAAEGYRTSWDAIGHLDDHREPNGLSPSGKWADLLPSIPEGHNYLWHTPRMGGEPLFGWRCRYWSFLLKLAKAQPAWTIQADPGPATGPFHWRNRQLSIAELCALQTFPADYELTGTDRAARRQVGNAVPCALGELLGLEIRRQLLQEPHVQRSLSMIPPVRRDQPRAQPRRPVPRKYLHLRSSHADHPGTGLGPGKQ
jgi:DNA (cytosine-5)-methyltransferase 1